MSINKLLNDINEMSKNTELAEIADCVITLVVTRRKILKIIQDKERPGLDKEYNDAVNDFAVVASSVILGDARPTNEEMRSLLQTQCGSPN